MKALGKMCITCIIGVLLICICRITIHANEEKTILNGVYIDSLDVSGMTRDEAREAYEAYFNGLKLCEITVVGSKGSVNTTLETLGITSDVDKAIDDAIRYGQGGNVLTRYRENRNLLDNTYTVYATKTVDATLFDAFITDNQGTIASSATDATIKRENGTFVITPEIKGEVLDKEATKALLEDNINNSWTGDSFSMDIVAIEGAAIHSSEQLANVKDLLGTWTTHYSGPAGRNQNIATGTAFVDGRVLYPGEEFSMYDTVAPFTIENGYAEATQYVNGEVTAALGGGICQVSSTLYNAVIRAELEVTERSPHSMVVDYVPISADAAIAGTYKNFKFVNNTENPIYIEGYAGDGAVTFNIYGCEYRPANRTISIENNVLETIEPGEDIVKVDETLPMGYSQVTQGPHTGYKAELWKYVYIDGQLTDKIKLNYSSYSASPSRVTKGPENPPVADPNAGTPDPGVGEPIPEEPVIDQTPIPE